MHTCQIVICLPGGTTPYVYEAKYFSYWKGGWHNSPKKFVLIQAILLEHGFEHKTLGAWVTTLTSFRSAFGRAKSFMTTKNASDTIW